MTDAVKPEPCQHCDGSGCDGGLACTPCDGTGKKFIMKFPPNKEAKQPVADESVRESLHHIKTYGGDWVANDPPGRRFVGATAKYDEALSEIENALVEREAMKAEIFKLRGDVLKALHTWLDQTDKIRGLEQEAKLVEKIEDMAAEFGDDPKQCLSIIGEHIGLFRHHQQQAAIKKAGEPK